MPNKFWSFVFLCIFSLEAQAQLGNSRTVTQTFNREWIDLDSLSIYPSSFVAMHGKDTLKSSAFQIDFLSAKFRLVSELPDSLTLHYQVWPIDFSKQYLKRDTSFIFQGRPISERDRFKIEANAPNPNFFAAMSSVKMEAFPGESVLAINKV